MKRIPTATMYEFTGHNRPVWHVFRGPHFIGAFSKEAAQAMVEMLNAQKPQENQR